jgi:EAL domain-containing protein (putative c-di-GMP-specific phosphodiesterase class I)
LLRELHCNEIQGYLVSPPLSTEAINDLLAGQPRSVSA